MMRPAARSYTAAVSADGAGGRPLGDPPGHADLLRYGADLGRGRRFAADQGRRAGLPPQRVGDLVIVVGELTANTVALALLAIWSLITSSSARSGTRAAPRSAGRAVPS